MKITKNNYVWLTILLFIALISTFVFADEQQQRGFFRGSNPIIGDWYHVTDEEVQFCQQWGGYQEILSDSNIIEENLPAVGKLTMTAQGLVSTISIDNFLYEIAWYVHPVEGDVAYVVYLVHESGQKEELDGGRGFADALDGDSNYIAFESDKRYTAVRMEIEAAGTLQVPIVEKRR